MQNNNELFIDHAQEIKQSIIFDVYNTTDRLIHTLTLNFLGSAGYIIEDKNDVYDKAVKTFVDGPIYLNRDKNLEEKEDEIYFRFPFSNDEPTYNTYKDQYIELLEFLSYCNIDLTAKTIIKDYR